jgi:pimeloyl-ACP methyl ester carboxylesterase
MNEFRIPSCGSIMRWHDLPGNEDPLLFIHGLGCSGSMDYPCVAAQPSLCGKRRILVDLLGAGFSDKPDDFSYSVEDHAAYLKLFVESLNLGAFSLFGHSLGGAVAISLARLCREQVRSLILTESNLDPSRERDVSKFIANQPEERFLATGFDALIAKSRTHGSRLWAASLSLWSPKAVHRFSCSAAHGGIIPWRETLYALPCRKTFVFGERSLPDPDFTELAEHGVTVAVIPRAGHGMAWENPEALASLIADAATFVR